MNKKFYLAFYFFTVLTFTYTSSQAQCTWQTTLTDGFEYTTICPDLVPGATIHNTPQQFAVYTGSYSLYLNFTNCVSGVGTCPGDTAYKRHFTVCRNMDYRFSAWFTTSFGGTQCNIKMVVTDGNGTALNVQSSIVPPYAPAWIQYNSGTVTPATDDLYLIIITNVGGGGGNDLSMDDLLFETCSPPSGGASTTVEICSSLQQVNLYNYLPAGADTLGTWSGPSVLTGGYEGTYDVAASLPGDYIYAGHYYGFGPGCPPSTDTVSTVIIPAPAVALGNDTTICSNQSIILQAGTFPNATYLWNTGSVNAGILAFYSVTLGDTVNYYVTVTSNTGCKGSDTIQVIFMNCTGINDYDHSSALNLYPNPSVDFMIVSAADHKIDEIEIYDGLGRKVKSFPGVNDTKIYTGDLTPGIYTIRIVSGNKSLVKKFQKN